MLVVLTYDLVTIERFPRLRESLVTQERKFQDVGLETKSSLGLDFEKEASLIYMLELSLNLSLYLSIVLRDFCCRSGERYSRGRKAIGC